jgi:hypothetical protein
LTAKVDRLFTHIFIHDRPDLPAPDACAPVTWSITLTSSEGGDPLEDTDGQAAVAGAAGGLVGGIFSLLIAIVMVVSLWKIFAKAGQPGWASVIPIYNEYVLMTQVVGRPLWFFLLVFVPCLNAIALVITMFDLAKAFGKGIGFAIGMILLPVVFIPLLAFGDSEYQGPVHTPG